jgi:hypothetical protein
MRRVGEPSESQRGAVGVVVALLLVALLGFAALALDVGRIYAEKAQLQNGADAAALGVAQICAANSADSRCETMSSVGQMLTSANANDGLSELQELVVEKSVGSVTVKTDAHELGRAPNDIPMLFAPALGIDSVSVNASAIARWGGPSAGSAPFAIAFSQCEIDSRPSVDGSLKFLRAHGVGSNDKACTSTSSGQELPGGFGWLVQEPKLSCSVSITLASPLEVGDPGSNFKTGCEAVLEYWKKQLEKGEPVIAFFPVFDKIVDGQYRIEAFAAFDVRGWNFYNGTGKFALSEAQSFMPSSGYSETGFIGKFVEYVAIDDSMEFGGSTKYGAKIVSLTE